MNYHIESVCYFLVLFCSSWLSSTLLMKRFLLPFWRLQENTESTFYFSYTSYKNASHVEHDHSNTVQHLPPKRQITVIFFFYFRLHHTNCFFLLRTYIIQFRWKNLKGKGKFQSGKIQQFIMYLYQSLQRGKFTINIRHRGQNKLDIFIFGFAITVHNYYYWFPPLWENHDKN